MFHDGAEVQDRIVELLAGSARVRVAVAYWGKGAVSYLQLESLRGRDVKIVCDLGSGACNPVEVEELQKLLGKKKVLTCDKLHAKVWLTESGAIIGSSNASANGLALEAKEVSGSIEANISVRDVKILGQIKEWFSRSVEPYSREITQDDIESAKRLWKIQRETRPSYSRRTLLATLREDPAEAADRNVQVWVCEWVGSPEAKMARDQKRRDLNNKKISCWELSPGERPPPPGALVIVFDKPKRRAAKFEGIFKILSEDHVQKVGGKKIVFHVPSKDVYGLKITMDGRAAWERAATSAASSTPSGEWDGSLEEFAIFVAHP